MKKVREIDFGKFLGVNVTLFFILGMIFLPQIFMHDKFFSKLSIGRLWNSEEVAYIFFNGLNYAALAVSVLYFVSFLRNFSFKRLGIFFMCVFGGFVSQYLLMKTAFPLLTQFELPIQYMLRFCLLAPYIGFLINFNWLLARCKTDPDYVRGSVKIKKNIESTLINYAKKSMINRKDKGIKIWKNVFLPRSMENQHILVSGSPGSGKTQIIYPMIEQAIDRGDKVIIWDMKGIYTQSLYDRRNVLLLAPWDKRSISWGLGRDVRNRIDCMELADIIVPSDTHSHQKYFQDSAKQIVETIILDLYRRSRFWTWSNILDYILKGREGLINKINLNETERSALSLIEGQNVKSAQDVFSTVVSSMKPIRWLSRAWKTPGICLRDWIHDDMGGALILGGAPNKHALAATTANLALYTLINEILSLHDDQKNKKRFWFILDEFGSLGKNTSIFKALTTGRSKGLCCVLGIQDISQIEHYYGKPMAKSITNSFLTNIFLRNSDVESCEWASNHIGTQEVLEDLNSQSNTKNGNDLWDSNRSETKSSSQSHSIKKVFLPSEISNFSKMSGVLKVAGWPVAHITWPYKSLPQNHPVTIEADWVSEKPEEDNPKDDEQGNWRLD